jgi:hypothetical protein
LIEIAKLLPPPVLQEIGRIMVVRDDLLPGGTKRRALAPYLARAEAAEFVYASPVYGYAQIALGHAARDAGKKATIFSAHRRIRHPRTIQAINAGVELHEVPSGYLSNVQSKARQYAQANGAELVPFGLDAPHFLESIAEAARAINISPKEVWTVAGSGVLTRALQMAWPDAAFHAVQVGHVPDVGRARLRVAPERFEDDAKYPPSFPSCSNYDAKAWRFMKLWARPGAIFWNVGA